MAGAHERYWFTWAEPCEGPRGSEGGRHGEAGGDSGAGEVAQYSSDEAVDASVEMCAAACVKEEPVTNTANTVTATDATIDCDDGDEAVGPLREPLEPAAVVVGRECGDVGGVAEEGSGFGEWHACAHAAGLGARAARRDECAFTLDGGEEDRRALR